MPAYPPGAYKVRWVDGVPEVWVYTAFGPGPAERGHTFVGIARKPEEYLTHVGSPKRKGED